MTDCVLWDGPVWAQGRYGMERLNGKSMTAHRAAWIKKSGSIPEGLFVCHKCDNGLCVNTNHLFLGTPKENMQDCLKKGRLRVPRLDTRGQKNGRAKPGLVERNLKIKIDRTAGLSYSQLCKKYDIKSDGHLRNILKG